MDPYRSQPRSEADRRNRRTRGEDRWSRRGDYEREPIDPFEGQGEREEWQFEPERGRRSFGSERLGERYDRGFEDLEDWQKPRQLSRPWDEERRDPRRAGQAGWYREEGRPPYGYGQSSGYYGQGYGQGPSQRQRAWDTSASEFERFGTRQPFGSGAAETHIGKGPKGYRRSDERIQEELSDRLTADPQIDASEISVTVRQGEVTLEGSVSERSMKRAAEDLAEDVHGVQEVHNRLRVEQQRSTAESTTASRVGGSHPSGTRSGESR
jgi:osmotically-inducible protein OsmY